MSCKCFADTLVLPLLSSLSEQTWIQALVFFILMLSLFMGIAIIADIFMCSIERITSSTKKIYKRKVDSIELEVIEIPIWNKTVANLTLMALGSSAPEILLATIEVIGNGFKSDDLGPGAIVGASAFNLFVITAFCVIAIPHNESKRVFAIKVFAISSFFNIFAYVWQYLVLKVISPDEVSLTEAIFTLLFFPALVFSGYAADKHFFIDKKWKQFGVKIFSNGLVSEKNLARFIKEVRKIDSFLTIEECEQLAKLYIFNNQKHSQMFYRISAIRLLSASNSPIPQLNERLQTIYDKFEENLSKPRSVSKDSESLRLEFETHLSTQEEQQKRISFFSDSDKAIMGFASEGLTIKESESKIDICVQRSGKLDIPVICEVETIDRTAIANCEYKPIKELLTFKPMETEKWLTIELMSDHEWSPNKVFLVKLNLPNNQISKCVTKGAVSIMQVTIVDDNEPGIVEFVQRFLVVSDSQSIVNIPLIRCQGSDGEVRVHWKTIDGSGKNGQHFYGGEGEVIFGEGMTKKDIQIPIICQLEDQREEYYFEIVLIESIAGGMIGRINRVMVTITDDQNYDNTMKKIMPKLSAQNSFQLHRDEWLDQFKDAFSFGDRDEKGLDEPSVFAYILHFMSFQWKVLFAFIPPTRLCGGWLTFFCSLGFIGILTALMGDFASAFGCFVGLSEHVTALTFVALGTSLPDLFASRVAAVREQTADNAIGNIFGSNAFNVFLGLGLPWFAATCYHTSNGTRFVVDSNSLEFSVIIYIVLGIIAVGLMVVRRNYQIFGSAELGGPNNWRWITFGVFISFWVLYIGLSIWWDIKT